MVLYGIIWLRILLRVMGIQVTGIQISNIRTNKQNLFIGFTYQNFFSNS